MDIGVGVKSVAWGLARLCKDWRDERGARKRENLRRNGARKKEREREREKAATVAREAAPGEQKPCKPVWAVPEPGPVCWCGCIQREQPVVGLPSGHA